jgi:lipopolysaccharide/colanic/teichoic acid biosynthesis glycosyltransferase
VIALPIFGLAALAIYLSSSGPIFYHAQRVGKDQKLFDMLKFRTMRVNCDGPAITGHRDPRIFRVGYVLRKLKVDELPQMLNVLKGEMSIVGPRPEDPRIVRDHYTVPWMLETLKVCPGITSPGAVFYYTQGEKLIDPDDPETSYVKRLLEPKLAIERAYLDRATLRGDLVSILRTIVAIIAAAFDANLNLSQHDIIDALRFAPASSFPTLSN